MDDDGKPVGEEREHQVPHGKHLRVHTGDYVKEGDPLVFGPLVPHDILQHLAASRRCRSTWCREVQAVYRSQRVDIDDKHIEIIVSQMLRKVKVETMGDTGLLPGSVIDKFAFREVNDRLKRVREDQGRRRLASSRTGKIVSKEAFEEERARLEAEDKKPPTFVHADAGDVQRRSCWASPRRRCSRTASSRRRRFQETTKVLTEAALAGKVDYLVGLKENVILGHLVPAGTGFHTHQEAEVRLNAPALAAATADGDGEVGGAGGGGRDGGVTPTGGRRRCGPVGMTSGPRRFLRTVCIAAHFRLPQSWEMDMLAWDGRLGDRPIPRLGAPQ